VASFILFPNAFWNIFEFIECAIFLSELQKLGSWFLEFEKLVHYSLPMMIHFSFTIYFSFLAVAGHFETFFFHKHESPICIWKIVITYAII